MDEKNDSIVRRVRSEFQEMPGLQLTAPQAERLWNLGREACRAVLETLVESGFLRYGDDARYRLSSTDPVRPVPRHAAGGAPRRNRHEAA